jgi:hypothetical protein
MNVIRGVMLLVLLMATAAPVSAGEMQVRAELVSMPEGVAPLAAEDVFPDDVRWRVEALYPATNNAARARIELRYSCVDPDTGGRYVPCYITLDPPVARADSGGHIDSEHAANRPTGRHQPSEGPVDDYGFFYSTYQAGEVGGIVDSTVHCVTFWVVCRDGSVSFGVGTQTLEELGAGVGYTLTGAKPGHPSNHWGEPNFVAAVQNVAELYVGEYPNETLLYNDISLEYGGVFDVRTSRDPGYDWNPPHSTHRLGTNMDIGIPRTVAQRTTLERLYRAQGVRVYREDSAHWHLIY